MASGYKNTARRARAREQNSKTILDCLLMPLCLPGMDETMFVTTDDRRQASRLLVAHILEVADGVQTGPLSDTPFRVDRDAVQTARKALEAFLDNSTEFMNIMAISKSGSNTPGASFSSTFFRASPDVRVIQLLCDKHASRLASERLRHMQGMLTTSQAGTEVFEVLRVATHSSITRTLQDLEFYASPFSVFTAPRVVATLFPGTAPAIQHLEQMYINLRLAEFLASRGEANADTGSGVDGSSSNSSGGDGCLGTLPSVPTSLGDLQKSPFFLAFGLLMGLSIDTVQSPCRLLKVIEGLVGADTAAIARLAVTQAEGGRLSVFMSPQTSTELDLATGNAWPSIIKSLSSLRAVCMAWMEMVMECVKSVATIDEAGTIPGTRFKPAGGSAVEAAWMMFVTGVHEVMGERGFHRIIKAVQVVAREIGDLGDGLALFSSRDMTQSTDIQYKPEEDAVVGPGGPMLSPHMARIISGLRADFAFVPAVYGTGERKQPSARASTRPPPGCTAANMSAALKNGREASTADLTDPGSALRFANMAAVAVVCMAPMSVAGPLIFRLGTTEAPGAFPMIPAVPGSGFVPSATALGTVVNLCTRVFHPAVPATMLAHHPAWNMTNPAIRRAVMELAYDHLLGLARAGGLQDVLPSTKRLASMRLSDVIAAARNVRLDTHALPMSRRTDTDVLSLAFLPHNAPTVLASRKITTVSGSVVPNHVEGLALACHRLASINAAAQRSIIGVASDVQITGTHSRIHTMRRMLLAEARAFTVRPATTTTAAVVAGTDEEEDALPSPFALLDASTHATARKTMLRTNTVMSKRQARLPFFQPTGMMNDTAEIGDDATTAALLNLAMRVFHAVFYVTRREDGPRAGGSDDDDEFSEWNATTHVCTVVMGPFLSSMFPAASVPAASKRLLTSVMSRVRTHVSHIAALTAGSTTAVTAGHAPVCPSGGGDDAAGRRHTSVCLLEEEDDDEVEGDDPAPSTTKTRVVIVKHAWTGYGMVASHVPGTSTSLSPELTRALKRGTTSDMLTTTLARINLPDASQVPGSGKWAVIDPGGDALTLATARTPSSSVLGGDNDNDDDDGSSGGEKPLKRRRKAYTPQQSAITDSDLSLLSRGACVSTNPEALIAVETLHTFIRDHVMTPGNTTDRFHVCAVKSRCVERFEVPVYGPCITTIGASPSDLKLRSTSAVGDGKKKVRRRIGVVLAAAVGLPPGSSVYSGHNNTCVMHTSGCVNYLHHTHAATK